jgi:hypothetical protein
MQSRPSKFSFPVSVLQFEISTSAEQSSNSAARHPPGGGMLPATSTCSVLL